ncbi:glycosyltransferase family 39 protein [Embleya hyalina]|uniref:Glycosyl transferase n=1 Tax=Embleya hyalina TaxID=516124 RepID=A0A401YMH0_9ACTN|nr:glycosyltransferase family 39 protein [Embleya hyalina]GCD95814.1 glycosyl transferase [Embleya hyalina]
MTRGSRRGDLRLLIPLLALSALAQAHGMTRTPQYTDDEGTYVAQAWAVPKLGALGHYTYWYDHPPLGWLQLSVWTTLTDGFARYDNAVSAGREAMLVAHVIAGALLWTLARRAGLSRPGAVVALGLYAFSPLAVAFHRMVYLDNIAVVWLLAALVLAYSPRRRLSAYAGAGLCLGIAILSKETFLLAAPLVVAVVYRRTPRSLRPYATAVAGAMTTLVLGAYLLVAMLKGELWPGPDHVSLWHGVAFQLWQRPSGGSLLDPGSLTRTTVDLWLRRDPVLLSGGLLAAVVVLLARRRADLRPWRATAWALVAAAALSLRPDGYVPVPYVVMLLPLCALLVGALVDGGSRTARASAESGSNPDPGPTPHPAPAQEPVPVSCREATPRAAAPAVAPPTEPGSPDRGSPGASGIAARRPGGVRVDRPAVDPRARIVIACAAALLAAHWAQPLLRAPDDVRPMAEARSWLEARIRPGERVLVDDAMWLDLVRDGLDRERVVWFTKPGADSDVSSRPEDYRYLVATESMRAFQHDLPSLAEALRRSTTVAVFGTGPQRVEVRRIS